MSEKKPVFYFRSFSFLVAFVFNWVGFLAGYCFSNSMSAQYGAVSGFGLSLVKWAFIVKVSMTFMSDNICI